MDFNVEKLQLAQKQIESVIIGKEARIRHSLACILANGHLLIEDVPGVGKTTLAHAIAITLGLDYNRLQFTSDLLPSDVTGVSVYHREKMEFVFHPGPVFANLLLADEINRAPPKTQSALLEAMEEHQVSAEGQTHSLPKPFCVIATQNPSHQIGTFPLPESQLDRFLMAISMGYPSAQAEEELLLGQDRRSMLLTLMPVMSSNDLLEAQKNAARVHVSHALVRYVRALLDASRAGQFVDGLSPRAGIGLLRAAKAWAALDSRQHVMPEDVQAVFPSVVTHRLRVSKYAGNTAVDSAGLVEKMLSSTPL